MEIKNKLEKFLLGLSSFFLAALIILTLKVEDDKNRIALIEDELASAYNLKNATVTQKLIDSDRKKILDKIQSLPKNDPTIKIDKNSVPPAGNIIKPSPVTPPALSPIAPQTSKPRKTRTS